MTKAFLNILIYILFPSIFTSIFTINVNNTRYIFYMLISYILLTIFFIIKYRKELTNDIKSFKPKNIKIIIIYWIIGFTLMILSNYIINYIIIPNGISNNESGNRELLLNNKITYSIILCILIPFLEEISFRLEFKKNIKNKKKFIITSSLAFAIPHIISTTNFIELLYIIPYLILGLTFSTIYQKTDNIFSNILAHTLHNTITTLIILLF